MVEQALGIAPAQLMTAQTVYPAPREESKSKPETEGKGQALIGLAQVILSLARGGPAECSSDPGLVFQVPLLPTGLRMGYSVGLC